MRKSPSKLDFDDILSRLQIGLSDHGPRLVAHKLIDFGIEIVDVMLCAQERHLRRSGSPLSKA